MGDQHRATRVIEREIRGNCRDGEDNPGHSLRPEVSLTEISPRAIIQFAWLFTNLKLPSPKVLICRITRQLDSPTPSFPGLPCSFATGKILVVPR
jgi:hypothetical protein